MLQRFLLLLACLATFGKPLLAQTDSLLTSSDTLGTLSKAELKKRIALGEDSLRILHKQYKKLKKASNKAKADYIGTDEYKTLKAERANWLDSVIVVEKFQKAKLDSLIKNEEAKYEERNTKIRDSIRNMEEKVEKLNKMRIDILYPADRTLEVTKEDSARAKELQTGPGNIDVLKARIQQFKDSITPKTPEILDLQSDLKRTEKMRENFSKPVSLPDSVGEIQIPEVDKKITELDTTLPKLKNELYGERFRPYHNENFWVQFNAGITNTLSLEQKQLTAEGDQEPQTGSGYGFKLGLGNVISRKYSLYFKGDFMLHQYNIDGEDKMHSGMNLNILFQPLYTFPVSPYVYIGTNVFSPLGEDASLPTWGNGTGARFMAGGGLAVDGEIIPLEQAKYISFLLEYDQYMEYNGSTYNYISFGLRFKPWAGE